MAMIRRSSLKPPLNPLFFEGHCGSRKELAHFKGAAETVTFSSMGPEPKARDLYAYLFPNESEPWEGIAGRIADMQALHESPELMEKYGDSRFHVILAKSGMDVVGYTQFATLPVGEREVVVHLQYGGVADEEFTRQHYKNARDFRRQGIGSAYYPIRHGLAAEDAEECQRQSVLGTVMSARMIGQEIFPGHIRSTRTMLDIHNSSGMMAIMLDMGMGSLVTAHMRPRHGTEPLLMHSMFRPVLIEGGLDGRNTRELDPGLAYNLHMALADNLGREGFHSEDVSDARTLAQDRFRDAKRVLLVPPSDLPDLAELALSDPLLKKQVERDYGSLDEQKKRIDSAFGR